MKKLFQLLVLYFTLNTISQAASAFKSLSQEENRHFSLGLEQLVKEYDKSKYKGKKIAVLGAGFFSEMPSIIEILEPTQIDCYDNMPIASFVTQKLERLREREKKEIETKVNYFVKNLLDKAVQEKIKDEQYDIILIRRPNIHSIFMSQKDQLYLSFCGSMSYMDEFLEIAKLAKEFSILTVAYSDLSLTEKKRRIVSYLTQEKDFLLMGYHSVEHPPPNSFLDGTFMTLETEVSDKSLEEERCL